MHEWKEHALTSSICVENELKRHEELSVSRSEPVCTSHIALICVCVCVCVCVKSTSFFIWHRYCIEKKIPVTLIFYLNKSLYILITVKWLAVAYKSHHFIKPLFFTLSLSFFLPLSQSDRHQSLMGCEDTHFWRRLFMCVCVCVAKESGMLEVVAWCHLQRAFSLEWHCLT